MQMFTLLKRLGLSLAMVFIIGCGGSGDAEADATAEGTEAPVEEAAEAAPAAPAVPGREVLPGASSVRDSLAKKDYATAVGGLFALRGAATQGEAHTEYLNLYGEVLDTLRAEAATDPKAAEALAKFNLATRGR